MTRIKRFAAALGLTCMAFAAPVGAESFPLVAQSSTGAYLAAQQAMIELRTHDAADFFRNALIDGWDNPLVLNRAFVAFASDGSIEESVDAAKHLIEREPQNALARLVVGIDALKQRRYVAAASQLDGLGADTFEGITASVLRSWALVGAGKADDAFAGLDKVSQGIGEEFLAFPRAIMADIAGRSDEAVSSITQAHDSAPYDATNVEAYARILGNAGRFDEAIDAIVEYEAQGLSSPLVTEVKEMLAKKQRPGLYADSVQTGAADFLSLVGRGFARDGTMDISMLLMRLAQYLDPKNDTIAIVVGQLYDSADQPALANAIYDSIPSTSPLKPEAVVRVAGNLDALGDRPQAIRRLGNIVAVNPKDLDAIFALGNLYRADKQYQAAAETYGKALEITGGSAPRDWIYYYYRGIAYERSGQFPLAEPDFLKALDLNPGQPDVLNYLGYSWVDKGMNLQRALDMIQKAVTASPNDGYIIDSLGWAHYRLARYDLAVVELEAAVHLRPNDPEINDHLGDAYWRVGRKLEARFQWTIAASLDKDGDVKARVAPKLKDGLPPAEPVTEDQPPAEPSSSEPPPANQALSN